MLIVSPLFGLSIGELVTRSLFRSLTSHLQNGQAAYHVVTALIQPCNVSWHSVLAPTLTLTGISVELWLSLVSSLQALIQAKFLYAPSLIVLHESLTPYISRFYSVFRSPPSTPFVVLFLL